jgi:WD40 repeat protein
MTNRRSSWWNHGAYPKGMSFAEMLDWHLSYWGTKPDCSLEYRNPCESTEYLATVFHEGTPDRKPGNSERKLLQWRKGEHPPSDETVVRNILRYLFGDDERLKDWKRDLQEALEKAQNKADAAEKSSEESGLLKSALRVLDSLPQNRTDHLGADAQHGVKVIADELAKHFYGRTTDLAVISDFVDARMAGGKAALLIVTAPAGFGKSALAVNWCNSMDSHPSRCVAMHLCSISSGRATTSLDNIYANLHRQIAAVYGVPPQTLKDKDAVAGLLATTPPGNKQLVLWLDGLDEADELVPCFLPQKLGELVCFIVSARAEDKVTPAYIDEWQYGLRAEPHSPHRHVLNKLSKGGVQDLLNGLCRTEGLTPSDRLAERIYTASEQGYPLFARLMADDALEAMRKREEVDLGDAPESLAGYTRKQLNRLRTLPVWPEYQPLFAFLTIAREAVRTDELPALTEKRLLPEALPDQVARWFNLVADDGHDRPPMLSFAHPKLAELFGRALGYQRPEAARSVCKRMVKTDPEEWPLYAWRHIPRHLLENGMIAEAVRYLIDVEFIAARFATLGAEDCLTAMKSDWMAWYGMSQRGQQKQTDSQLVPMRHLRFWNNYSDKLFRAAVEGFDWSWLQMMHDVGLIETQTDIRLVSPNPQILPDSLATLRGHEDSVSGALLLPNGAGFLSWSSDRTLRLWDSAGEERAVLRGHEDSVSGALLLPNGAGFLSWSSDRTLRLWDSAGEERAVLRGHEDSVSSALLLPNGAGFLSWSSDRTLRLWEASGEEGAVLCGHNSGVNGALVLPDGNGFLSWSSDRTLRLWGSTGEERRILSGHENDITGALLLPDGDGFLSWGQDGTLRLWEVSGEERAVLYGHKDLVKGVVILPDGDGFLSWGQDGMLRLWEVSGEERAVLRGHQFVIKGALLLPGGDGFISLSLDGTLRMWNSAGEERVTLRGHQGGVTGALVLPRGDGFLSWGHDKTLRVWAASGGERAVLRGHEEYVTGALVLPDSDVILSWSSDYTLRLWDTSGTERSTLLQIKGVIILPDGDGFLSWDSYNTLRLRTAYGEERAVLCGHKQGVIGALAMPGGDGFLSWSHDNTLRLWGPRGEQRAILSGHKGSVYGAYILPDGNGILSRSEDGTLRVWNPSGQQRSALRGHEGAVRGALILSDGNGFLSWGDDCTLRLWSEAGEERAIFRGHQGRVNGALVLPRGEGFLSWSVDETLRLWASSGQQRAVLRGHEGSVGGALNLPGGNGFLSWGADGTLRLWGWAGKKRAVLRGHETSVSRAILSAIDAGYLSWSGDGTLRLWGSTGEERAVLRGHQGWIKGALILQDGAGILSWGEDGTLRLWDLSGQLRNLWYSPSGKIIDVRPYSKPEHYLVASGSHVGIVNLPLYQ